MLESIIKEKEQKENNNLGKECIRVLILGENEKKCPIIHSQSQNCD